MHPNKLVDNLAQDILAARVKALHDNLRFVLIANVVAATLIGPAQAMRSGGLLVLIWWGALVGLTLLRAVGWHWAISRLDHPGHVKAIYRQFLFGSAASGCLWGLLGLIGYDFDAPREIILIVLALSGMTAGAVSSLSAFFEIYAVYAIPTMMPLLIRLLFHGDAQSVIESGLGLTFLAVNLAYSRQYHGILGEAIALRFQREELIEDLTAEKLRVEQASRAKSQFIAGISHDIRQPVHAIALITDSLERESGEAAKRPIEAIKNALHGLDQLLESFLDIAKIEAGVIQPNIRPIRLQTLFDDLDQELRPWASEKGLSLKIVPTAVELETDPTLLMRVLRNLAVNAIKHTRKGGVLIGCRRFGPHHTRIEIWDTGVGIRSDRLTTIFREFYTGSHDETPEPGLGLGLAIADGLARTLETRIRVRSVLGRGSVFSAGFPIVASTQRSEPLPAAEASGVNLEGRRVFLVDDEPVIIDAMEHVLRAWNCQVFSARSITSALARLATQDFRPEILLLDQRLRAGETGDRLLQQIDEMLGEYLPAVIITGDTALDLHKRAGGVRLIMYKPVTPLKLRAALVTALMSPTQARREAVAALPSNHV
jgi:signal transduction histidine kinase/CheY-like chemotaxis protein